MTATKTSPFTRFTIYPTIDGLDYSSEQNDKAYRAFCDWMMDHGFTSVFDPESDEDCVGYFVYDIDGQQVAAVTLTDR
ncbi:hypothetical protein F8M49_21215 [Rhodococcus zopfii]|uniref:Uncharacterized protein n=1 Tax=Rhodococcus zopfii TaxID=43772 RepID=A0ABU3WMF2_9NOCA|nr:hypothetical protein [Rhodococcus zopfii]MDV2477241.1 hypothetical protein [Rhodococcus zopfii]